LRAKSDIFAYELSINEHENENLFIIIVDYAIIIVTIDISNGGFKIKNHMKLKKCS